MKFKLLVVAVAVLALAGLSFAQCINWYNESYTLRKGCTSGDVLPIGVPIYIMNDQNGNGWVSCANPDPADPLAQLCDDPLPEGFCESGNPPGSFLYNTMHMGEVVNRPGNFVNDYYLCAQGMQPLYPRFYLKIHLCETTAVGLDTCVHCVTWLSRVVICPDMGVIYDADMSGDTSWTCCVRDTCWSGIPPCVPDLYTEFGPIPWPQGGPQHFHDCAKVCAMRPHVVSVGPLVAPNRKPHGFVLPGCSPTNTPCDSECVPAQGWTFGPLVWTLRFVPAPVPQYWYDAIIVPLTGATDGCVCIVVDFIENAEIGEVAVVPLSNSVKITWRTLSETNLDGFAIYRDNARIATKKAANSASGATYEYVDGNVENGRTYNYDLRSVDINGAEMSFHTASVTPSFENALVTEYALHQNYPNPFNPSTKIAFDLVENNPVTLTVYNATGQVVATLINGVNYAKGRHSIAFDSGNLTSGLYFYTVKIGNEFTATKKMLLVK
jgi:hypothetical protein